MNIPADLRYTKEHEWVRVDGNVGIVGITDYAQLELGDIVNIELPEEGVEVAREDILGAVESVKASSEIYSPVSGKVIEINEPLMDAPETVNEDPYDEGWMVKIELKEPSEIKNMMDAAAYQAYVKEESK